MPANLSVSLTPFFGRQAEMNEIQRLLAASRLLTLTGPGGCGKTRLALEVGRSLLAHYPDGVWLVDLAQVSEPRQVVQAVAQAVGIAAPGRQDLETLLLDYLQPRHALLLLDNCEHVVDETARLSLAILARAERVKILATSQVPLRIPAEQEWLVPSLPLPEPDKSLPALAELRQVPALQLFCDRAQAVLPAFRLTADNAPLVVDICRHLDGIPLAIELAAARVKLLSLEQIAGRLHDRFALLSGPQRRVTWRHQTLEAAITWSFSLLNPREQRLLCRLAVFAGPWRLEAAQAVCAFAPLEPGEVLALLGGLVDRSLVTVTQHESRQASFRLLETIRLYGLAHQAEGESPQLLDQLLAWAERLVTVPDHEMHGPGQAVWLDRLEASMPNLLAALEWACAEGAAPPRLLAGLRLAGGLAWFWIVRGGTDTAIDWLERLLHLAGEREGSDWTPARAAAQAALARFYLLVEHNDTAAQHDERSRSLWAALGENGLRGYALATCGLGMSLPSHLRDRCKAYLQEALDLFTTLGDRWGAAEATFNLGLLAWDQDPAQAESFYLDALALFRAVDDRLLSGQVIYQLSRLMIDQSRYDRALAYLEEAQRCFTEFRSIAGIGWCLRGRADVHLTNGDLDGAEALYRQAVPYVERAGSTSSTAFTDFRLAIIRLYQARFDEARELFLQTLSVVASVYPDLERVIDTAMLLTGLAACAAQADPVHAARLVGKAQAVQQASGAYFYPIEHRWFAPLLSVIRQRLGPTAEQQAMTEGAALPLNAFINVSVLAGQPRSTPTLRTKPSPAPQPPGQPPPGQPTALQAEKARFSGLTAREREIARRIAQGYTNPAIARELMLSERTVTTHVTHILSKLGFSARTQIAAWAVEKGLIQVE